VAILNIKFKYSGSNIPKNPFMTYDNIKPFFAVSHRPWIYAFIILILMFTIAGTLIIGEWLIANILSGKELQTLENFSVFSTEW
jgi:hypothetical protein